PATVGTYATSRTVDSLLPGTYRVIAPMVLTAGGVRYRAAQDTVSVTVASGDTATVSITYAESPAIVRVLVAGLPAEPGITPQVTLQAGTAAPIAITPGASAPIPPSRSTPCSPPVACNSCRLTCRARRTKRCPGP
ncbi:MAG: hypothetical protein MUD17_11800, partial [Gemmatimonadaceae bacterium]|nr:hypothetical protein [Gemmatimonadaceae bacterium]